MERCRLLELPGELRNMIYEIVLTYPRGLLNTPKDEAAPGFITYSGTARGAEGAGPNSLRSVFRQLHYDTKNLLLKYNCCVFKGECQATYKTNCSNRDVSAVTNLDRFFNFIYGCGAPGPRGLRKVTIQHEASMHGRDLDDIFRILADDSLLHIYYRYNPRVQVIIRFYVMCTISVNPGAHLGITISSAFSFEGD
jgi:hypothetical protein